MELLLDLFKTIYLVQTLVAKSLIMHLEDLTSESILESFPSLRTLDSSI